MSSPPSFRSDFLFGALVRRKKVESGIQPEVPTESQYGYEFAAEAALCKHVEFVFVAGGLIST